MMQHAYLADPGVTDTLGCRLAVAMPAKAVLFLVGDLGAGKSSLARSMLRALGVTGPIKSPTYTLVERYPLPGGEAVHMDLYRIAEAAELEFLGIAEFAQDARLMLVEWPERAAAALPPPDLEARLVVEGDGRRIALTSFSDAGSCWLTRLNEMAPPSASS